jgi:hypothetical protein
LVEIANLADALGAGQSKPQAAKPAAGDVADFSAMMQPSNASPTANALNNFVQSAQDKIDVQGVRIDQSLRQFDKKFSVMHLVGAMHESSMKSVSIQLSGKVASKTSEGFEQLVKQQ